MVANFPYYFVDFLPQLAWIAMRAEINDIDLQRLKREVLPIRDEGITPRHFKNEEALNQILCP